MNTARGIFRLFHLVAHIIRGLIISYTKLHGTQSHHLTNEQHRIIQKWLHKCAEIIGIDIQVNGSPSASPLFVVANHISWLDILIISSVLPTSFLSKEEVRNWPFLGALAAKAGTLFIKRGSKNAASNAIDLIKTKLSAGHSVASFPEAKTTDGTSVHQFHPRLFAAAIDTETHVQPTALRYPAEDGPNQHVPYVNHPNLINHAFRIMSAKYTVAEVTFCDPIPSEGMLRKELADRAKEAILNIIETKKKI